MNVFFQNKEQTFFFKILKKGVKNCSAQIFSSSKLQDLQEKIYQKIFFASYKNQTCYNKIKMAIRKNNSRLRGRKVCAERGSSLRLPRPFSPAERVEGREKYASSQSERDNGRVCICAPIQSLVAWLAAQWGLFSLHSKKAWLATETLWQRFDAVARE